MRQNMILGFSKYFENDRLEKALVDEQGLYFAYTFRKKRSQKFEE